MKAEHLHWQRSGLPMADGYADGVVDDEHGGVDSEDEGQDTDGELSSLVVHLSPFPDMDSRNGGCKERCWPWCSSFL